MLQLIKDVETIHRNPMKSEENKFRGCESKRICKEVRIQQKKKKKKRERNNQKEKPNTNPKRKGKKKRSEQKKVELIFRATCILSQFEIILTTSLLAKTIALNYRPNEALLI